MTKTIYVKYQEIDFEIIGDYTKGSPPTSNYPGDVDDIFKDSLESFINEDLSSYIHD